MFYNSIMCRELGQKFVSLPVFVEVLLTSVQGTSYKNNFNLLQLFSHCSSNKSHVNFVNFS